MANLLHFALLGLGVGALYVLTAQGLVLIYRGSGVLNFGQGAIGVSGAYVAWELQYNHGFNYLTAAIAGIAFSALIGVLVHNIVMRRLRRAAPLIRLVATLGLLLLLQAIATARYGDTGQIVESFLPVHTWDFGSGISVSSDRVYLLAIAIAVTAILWGTYRFTAFGRATVAVAENQRAAASVGISPDYIATVNWALGCGLAGMAAILLMPIQTLSVSNMSSLLLPGLAAALIGGFTSFPLTCLAGIAIGIAETEMHYWDVVPGLADAVPFIAIVLILVLRGRSLPLRDYLLQRLPTVGSGRVNPIATAVVVILGVLAAMALPPIWSSALTMSVTAAIILLSIVVLTGYAGQISLAQATIAGFAAFIAGRLAVDHGLPFLLALVVGVAATIPLAALFAFTAVKVRGPNLAIATLGLGSAIELLVLQNVGLTGGVFGITAGPPDILGLSIDPITHPDRYAVFCILVFAVLALAVANIRRGPSGRRLLAVRANERAAAALGINVSEAKLHAFVLATAIAAVGGVLMAFQSTTLNLSSFTSFLSIMLVALAIIGSVGYIAGPLAGSLLAPGGIGNASGNAIFSANTTTGGIAQFLPILSGFVLLQIVMQDPDGLAAMHLKQIKGLLGVLRSERLSKLLPQRQVNRMEGRRTIAPSPNALQQAAEPASASASSTESRGATASSTLEVRDVTVRYGGVVAVNGVTLTIRSGQVVGLIGPNGAGKTSLIDALTGFTRIAGGVVRLNEIPIHKLPAHRRVRMGVSRSFQSLELFEDLTVADNLRAASDRRDKIAYLADLVRADNPDLPLSVATAAREFGLQMDLSRMASDLSHGERRLLAITRAIALQPRILLLDEPAAGLSDVETAELGRVVRRLADEWSLGVLVVEHDVNFVMTVCDHIVVLDYGRVISQGRPDAVRADPAVVAAYIGEPHEWDGIASRQPVAEGH